jgi:hypothetical protein
LLLLLRRILILRRGDLIVDLLEQLQFGLNRLLDLLIRLLLQTLLLQSFLLLVLLNLLLILFDLLSLQLPLFRLDTFQQLTLLSAQWLTSGTWLGHVQVRDRPMLRAYEIATIGKGGSLTALL